MIVTVIYVVVSQFLLVFLKHYNVRVISNEKSFHAAIVTVGIQLTWLASSSLGIKAVFDHNWLVISAYVLSGGLGSFLSFKMRL